MIAVVFFMQPLGQLIVTLVAVVATFASRKSIPDDITIAECNPE